MRRRHLASALVVLAIVACEEDPRYVYTARRYNPAQACLEEYSSVETVPGDDVSVRCREACLAVRDVVYVSPVCPPLPTNAAALDDDDPRCQEALDASRMEASCAAPAQEEDGGEEEDGGTEEDADAGDPDAGAAVDAAEDG